MRSKTVILCTTGLLLLVGLSGTVKSQPPDLATKARDDTCEIAIEYATAYPGTGIWVTVWMKNPVPVTGYNFVFQLSSDAARFFCDTSGYWCFLDTVGCLTSIFPTMACLCQGNGWGAHIYAMADTEEIPPSPNYNCLFKIRMHACCIPDADTNRSASIYLTPETSYLVNGLGDLLPFRYQPGELVVWWSLPGDANGDSLVNISDIAFLTNYLFITGPEPCVCEAADCNNDNVINSGDVAYLINYLFVNGPAPIPGSKACWYETCRPY
jgi:hypothetical protein